MMQYSRRGQSASELLVILGFMFIVFLVVLSIGGSRLIQLQLESEQSLILDTADYLENELDIALQAESGYVRHFELPSRVGRANYEILIINGSNFTEVVVQFVNHSVRFDKTIIMPPSVSGNITIDPGSGTTTIRIIKDATRIAINST